jgi:ABC-type cobalamin transport system ATPase subunit
VVVIAAAAATTTTTTTIAAATTMAWLRQQHQQKKNNVLVFNYILLHSKLKIRGQSQNTLCRLLHFFLSFTCKLHPGTR